MLARILNGGNLLLTTIVVSFENQHCEGVAAISLCRPWVINCWNSLYFILQCFFQTSKDHPITLQQRNGWYLNKRQDRVSKKDNNYWSISVCMGINEKRWKTTVSEIIIGMKYKKYWWNHLLVTTIFIVWRYYHKCIKTKNYAKNIHPSSKNTRH